MPQKINISQEETQKKLPDNKVQNKVKNISQSQEVKMEIEIEESIKNNNLIGSLSTQESNHINKSVDANKESNHINCQYSCILPNKKTDVIFSPNEEIHPPKKEEVPNIPIPNRVMKQLAIERKKMLSQKEKEIFQFTNLSDKEKTAFNAEYLNESYLNLLEDVKKIIPMFGYMERQPEINPTMRAVLNNWLVDVIFKFNFKNETLYQTVFIIDAYLSKAFVKRSRLQLVGIAALLIACKENEVYYPRLDEFVLITDKAFSKEELIEMENDILKVLCFDIRPPTANDFYNIVSKAFNFDLHQYYLGRYFLDSTLIDYQMLEYSPSIIGVSCAYIVMKFFGLENYRRLYSNDMTNENNSEKIIKDAAKKICFLLKNMSNSICQATKNKYSSKKYLEVAQIVENQNNP